MEISSPQMPGVPSRRLGPDGFDSLLLFKIADGAVLLALRHITDISIKAAVAFLINLSWEIHDAES